MAFISKKAKNRNAAKLWMDYMLSQKGQDIIANQADLASVRDDIPGDNDVDGMTKKLGASLADPGQRNAAGLPGAEQAPEFIKQWRAAAGRFAAAGDASAVPAAPDTRRAATRRPSLAATRPPRRRGPRTPEHRISPCSHCAENGSPRRAAWWC